MFIFFETFDGSISRSVIRRILRACISYQVDYILTSDHSRSRRMVLEDIEAFTTIDSSIISRATQDVVILSLAGVFTLKATNSSLDRPSLFDEGAKTTDGHDCSRNACQKDGRTQKPVITPIENPEEYLRNNGAMTLEELINKVSKLG